jgi:hypothetical protein
MAKKAIYEPGELDGVKKRLGNIDVKEAKRMQKLLGGEVGEERTGFSRGKEASAAPSPSAGIAKPKRLIEVAPSSEDENSKSIGDMNRFQRRGELSYGERVKMDVCCGSREYDIKTPWQVFVSRLCFFKAPLDRVSPWFVKVLLNKYYEKLENLVTSTRLMFPRNNKDLSKKVRVASKMAFKVLNTIRQWKLDVVVSEIGRVQARPRSVFVKDFETILRRIYTPIYVMGRLEFEKDVKGAYSVLYDVVIKESSGEKISLQNKITEALDSYRYVCKELHRLLYPLLMKTIASNYQDYELFFYENSESYKAFLGVTAADQIIPESVTDKSGLDSDKFVSDDDRYGGDVEDTLSDIEGESELSDEKKAAAGEVKALDRSIKILETLFPQAPWDRMASFPDYYPYFADVLEIKKNGELIAPEDPAQVVLVLSQVIEELLYGFRYIKFKDSFSKADFLRSVVENWHLAILESFEKNYIPRIAEYAHFFEHSGQNRTATYAVNIASDIHWLRRYYFFPSYNTLPPTPPSFLKKDVVALYPLAHTLRKDLTVCASAIEAANRSGGSSSGADVEGIMNPWDAYNFEVENPLSKRLNMLLGKSQRNNTSLIFFTLAVVTVLDNYLCDAGGVAYKANNEILFRHADQEEMKPVFWVEKKNDTYELFKKSVDSLKKKKQ